MRLCFPIAVRAFSIAACLILPALSPSFAAPPSAPGLCTAEGPATLRFQTPMNETRTMGRLLRDTVYPAGHPEIAVAQLIPKEAGSAAPAQTDAAGPSEQPNECDRIAAPRAPSSPPSDVQGRKEPDWATAVPACEAMIKAQPGEMRFVYQLGRAQEHLKDYAGAARNYRIASEAGNPDAQLGLGVLYYDGHGALQNYTKAFELFSKAAGAGVSLASAKATANMGAMYADGRGVAKDDAKSLDLEERSVEMGYSNSLRLIAIHYFNGAGVARDYHMAEQYFQQAIDVGDGFSMKFLANMIEGGYLGKPDPTKAGELRLRAVQVDPDSRDPGVLQKYRSSSVQAQDREPPRRRRYVVYHPVYRTSYNPAWQAAPGDTRCCPNNMLVCPLGRHFCGH